MFDIGWTELLVIACIAIIVVGPKDLPRMLRSLGQNLGKLRRLSREFQSTFNDALREAEQQADIADMKKHVESINNSNPLGDLKKSIEQDFAGKSKPNGGTQTARPAAAATKSEEDAPKADTTPADTPAAPPPAETAAAPKAVAEDNKA
ncbi:MAG: twin-arginine translocase subunit TatB [Roseibium sp.]|nr:twin-arginine translocase subunit TatB [Roseibium sp.]